jgi:CDP-diacylglycerol--serine O-phosphatidyltransferase
MPVIAPPDGSRDLRIDDPSNVWVIHPAGRALVPIAIRLGISANAVSVAGLAAGIGAAFAYTRWMDWRWATLGFVLTTVWLIADGVDGMVARATNTASAFGRFMDGVCDHLVFLLLYLGLGWGTGTTEGWVTGTIAGCVHAVQATLYEGERMRFHRRLKGDAGLRDAPPPRNVLVRVYDRVANSLDRLAEPFDRALARSRDPVAFGAVYGVRATPSLKMLFPLSNNMRVLALWIACLVASPMWFWWFELVPLSILAAVGMTRHRRVEAELAGGLIELR